MTLGLIGGLVGAAAGVAGAAVGTAAGVAGAALHVGSQVVETACNIADAVVVELANFAVQEHCKRVGPTFKLKAIVDAKITVGPEGKTYCLFIQVEVYINGFWLTKTHKAIVHCPWLGLPSLSYFECVEGY